MTTTTEPTLDQVLDLAARLAPADQLRVIERLTRAIVPAVQADQVSTTPADHRLLWAQLRDSISSLPKERLTLAQQLEQDRADRDHALGGS